jgi:hypothetical protein
VDIRKTLNAPPLVIYCHPTEPASVVSGCSRSMAEKDDLCLKKVYPVRRSQCIPMKKQRLRRLPTAFTAKRDARRAKHMNTGFARSKRCVEKLRPRIPKVASRSSGPECSGRESSARSVSFPRIPCERRPHREGLGAEVARAFKLAGSERALKNAIFCAVCVGREIRCIFVSLGGRRGALGFSVIPERQRKRQAACAFVHLKVLAAKIRDHPAFHAAH